MKYFILFFVWILGLPAAPMAVCHLEAGLIDEAQLTKTQIDHDIDDENQPIAWIFLDVLRGTGIPAGVAQVTGCSDLPEAHLKVEQGTTVTDAMAAIVAANPTYQWILTRGAVNLEPRGGIALLDTKIGKFQMDTTDREIPAVLQDLLRLPEVGRRAAGLGLEPGLGQGGPGVASEHPVLREPVPIHVSVQNLSLQDAFNGVVRTSGHAIWIYRETDCNGNKTYIVETAPD